MPGEAGTAFPKNVCKERKMKWPIKEESSQVPIVSLRKS